MRWVVHTVATHRRDDTQQMNPTKSPAPQSAVCVNEIKKRPAATAGPAGIRDANPARVLAKGFHPHTAVRDELDAWADDDRHMLALQPHVGIRERNVESASQLVGSSDDADGVLKRLHDAHSRHDCECHATTNGCEISIPIRRMDRTYTESELATLDSFAKRLAWARKKAGFSSQAKLAKIASVSISSIGNYEAGSRFSAKHLLKLSQVLHCDAVWLQDGVGRPWSSGDPTEMEVPLSVRARRIAETIDRLSQYGKVAELEVIAEVRDLLDDLERKYQKTAPVRPPRQSRRQQHGDS